jgi:hypothetical protein
VSTASLFPKNCCQPEKGANKVRNPICGLLVSFLNPVAGCSQHSRTSGSNGTSLTPNHSVRNLVFATRDDCPHIPPVDPSRSGRIAPAFGQKFRTGINGARTGHGGSHPLTNFDYRSHDGLQFEGPPRFEIL